MRTKKIIKVIIPPGQYASIRKKLATIEPNSKEFLLFVKLFVSMLTFAFSMKREKYIVSHGIVYTTNI